MKIDFNHYMTVVQTGVQENWKPATAMVGVAILVAVVWGKTAVIGIALVYFGSYVAFGPSIKVMTNLDMKGFIIITALVGNGYFGLINPMLLNYYAGACMLAREWNFWRIHTDLSAHKTNLEQNNVQMRDAANKWGEGIEGLERQFEALLQKAQVAASPKKELDTRTGEVRLPIERDLTEIQAQLTRLNDLARLVLENKALMERATLAQRTRDELRALQREQAEARQKYQGFMEELKGLNEQLASSVTALQGQEVLKAQQIEILTRVIGNLRALR